jgi:hypothetical protein
MLARQYGLALSSGGRVITNDKVTDETREAVGVFAERESFQAAVDELKSTGFDHADLSVLATHEAIEAASTEKESWREVFNAFVNEIRYEHPLFASSMIFLAGGPVTATIAGIIAAAVGTLAVKDIIDEVVARPHTEEFTEAVEAGGAILWVRCPSVERERDAMAILEKNGATNVHVVDRSRNKRA